MRENKRPRRQIQTGKTRRGRFRKLHLVRQKISPSCGNGTMWDLIEDVFRHVDRWGTQQWLLALMIALSVGFACMRGLGSRSKY